MIERIRMLLGGEAENLLGHQCSTIPRQQLHLPGPDFIDRVWAQSQPVRRNGKSLGKR